MKRLYEPGAYSAASLEKGYWRGTAEQADYPALDGDATCDFAVIGAGYTGLSAALHLARDHDADVTVLEAEDPGWGASGRNGGFACIGGAMASDTALERRHGKADVAQFHKAQVAAIDLVAEILDRYGLGVDRHSQGETVMAHRPEAMTKLREEAGLVRARYGVEAELIERGALAECGMSGPEFHGALTVPLGFALNPWKYATGLARAAVQEGARIHGHSPVTAIRRADGGGYLLTTPGGTLRARHL
ncbi:MAG: FAD-dependent oxidoreductase, partial [Paracoccaceae bacterium]